MSFSVTEAHYMTYSNQILSFLRGTSHGGSTDSPWHALHSARIRAFLLFSVTRYTNDPVTQNTVATWNVSSVMVAEVYRGAGEIEPYSHNERMLPRLRRFDAIPRAVARRTRGAVLFEIQAWAGGPMQKTPGTSRNSEP